MHIEERLEQIATLLQAIHTALSSSAAVTPAVAPAATKPAKAPAAAPATLAAAPAAPAAPAVKATSWKDDVMPKILELNKSTKPGHGREGVLKLLAQFGLPEGSKVPALEPLNKHAEVLAAAQALLDGTAAGADDDLM
jgi:hypothetical protein